ncbi:MAG: hypothetical protein WBW49_04375, partial [Candidatus Acidiferrum sp.]
MVKKTTPTDRSTDGTIAGYRQSHRRIEGYRIDLNRCRARLSPCTAVYRSPETMMGYLPLGLVSVAGYA